ncbi:hypothetical protein PC129_g10882 [Phytophthora cactorum]|uniref:Uncharacterized protein n=1 Tax=Phytophthora cactorum TaxID=29920 RepID=A0A329S1B9_9STRA|nr:hypothetical protein Pcac1_g18417 [Phytophthora cactorum]KAG2904035.1 hypothetical protein PC114_g12006 [Phytophthora cactorum]KAG2919164.1 hypothetical protein PC115_g10239 [Phytophthora cactorum]KAG2937559.1 hypothetical protein PC117_g11648 [Phytophthora cactorum]KAG2991677.1 hypothetical protein PC118_g4966 [Phytophthora cactorum]
MAPLWMACAVLLHDDSSRRRGADDTLAVELGFLPVSEMAVGHGLMLKDETAVEQGLPPTEMVVEQWEGSAER